MQAGGETDEAKRGRGASGRFVMGGAIARAQRVEREEIQDVGQQQFLMLLLMLHAKLDEVCERAVAIAASGEEFAQARVHMGAIGEHLFACGPGQQAAPGTRMTRACGFVIRIEQIGEPLVKDAIAVATREDEGLVEPGRMGEVPLGGAGVVHRLDRLVLGRQRLRQFHRPTPGGEEPPFQLRFRRLPADGHAQSCVCAA